MAFSRTTGGQNFVTSAAVSAPVTLTMGAANRIILVFGANGSTTPTATIADTALNTWNVLQVKFTQTGSGSAYAWWALANGSGSTTITVLWSANPNFFLNQLVDVFSGNDTTSPISATNKASGASGAPSGTVTPLDNDCLLWGASNDSITAVGSGFSKGADDTQQDWSEYKSLTGGSGASQTVNFTGASAAWMLAMAAIKPVSGAAATWGPLLGLQNNRFVVDAP